jgi:hypothetical protein
MSKKAKRPAKAKAKPAKAKPRLRAKSSKGRAKKIIAPAAPPAQAVAEEPATVAVTEPQPIVATIANDEIHHVRERADGVKVTTGGHILDVAPQAPKPPPTGIGFE